MRTAGRDEVADGGKFAFDVLVGAGVASESDTRLPSEVWQV